MDELEAGWEAVLGFVLVSSYHRNLWVINFCVVITLKKNMKKEYALFYALTPDSFGRTFPLAEEHLDWRKRIIR